MTPKFRPQLVPDVAGQQPRGGAAPQASAQLVEETREGRAIFQGTACVNCHTVRGLSEIGEFGPDLTHLMSRKTLAAGAAPNNRNELMDWITNPAHIKPGARMPAMKLEPEEIAKVADFLASLH